NWQVKLLMISSEEKTEATVMEAFDYVISLRKKYNETNGAEGAFIVAINNSWGIEGFFEEDFPMLCDMFNALGEVGILGVGATENDQVNTDVFGDIPSDCSSDHLIVVTNTNQDDELAVAGFGRENVDLGAPGEQIYGADDNEGYRTYGGTSYAAPHVSGAIGLLYALSEVPFCDIARVSPTEAAGLVKRFIMEGVTPLPTLDRTVTGGRLNLGKTYDIVTSVTGPDPGDLRIYPNPTNAQSVLEFKGPGFFQRIVVKDILGRVMWSANNLKGDQLTIKAEDWKPGAYVVELLTSNGVASKILIKN
ncbi:MAG: S8 family peptidase, partial [Saprospiraceae bacterium]|nr:S8 family peptidase [Saprospiraceae bacterium]